MLVKVFVGIWLQIEAMTGGVFSASQREESITINAAGAVINLRGSQKIALSSLCKTSLVGFRESLQLSEMFVIARACIIERARAVGV